MPNGEDKSKRIDRFEQVLDRMEKGLDSINERAYCPDHQVCRVEFGHLQHEVGKVDKRVAKIEALHDSPTAQCRPLQVYSLSKGQLATVIGSSVAITLSIIKVADLLGIFG